VIRMLRVPLLVGPGGELDVLELERLLVERLGRVLALPLPGGDVAVVVVVAPGLALFGLVLLTEVAAAGLLPVEGVAGHELGEAEEVGDPTSLLEGLVEG